MDEQYQLFWLPVSANIPHIALRHYAQVREIRADGLGNVGQGVQRPMLIGTTLSDFAVGAPVSSSARRANWLMQDIEAFRTKAGIERAVVDILRKFGVLPQGPTKRPSLKLVPGIGKSEAERGEDNS